MQTLPSDFDPQAPFVAQDGLEYENLTRYLRGEAVSCLRNEVIVHIKRYYQEKGFTGSEWCLSTRHCYLYIAGAVGIRIPQLLDHYFPAS